MVPTTPKYVFFGSPDYALTILKTVVARVGPPSLVVAQPDRPVGRRKTPTPTPVAAFSREQGYETLTPVCLSDDDVTRIAATAPSFILVAAYGLILPPALLAVPALGAFNAHASLLPRYRGASPVAAAIWEGDAETGVTIMKMDAGLDTGPIVAQTTIPISDEATRASLTEALATLAGPLLVDAMMCALRGTLSWHDQDETEANYACKLTSRHGVIDVRDDAASIVRQVRSLWPWPKAHLSLNGRRLVVEEAHVRPYTGTAAPGTIIGLGQTIDIACGRDALALDVIIPAGSRRMAAQALAHNLSLGLCVDAAPPRPALVRARS